MVTVHWNRIHNIMIMWQSCDTTHPHAHKTMLDFDQVTIQIHIHCSGNSTGPSWTRFDIVARPLRTYSLLLSI